VVRQYPWEKGSDGKARALLNAIEMLSALAQDKLPYHFQKSIPVSLFRYSHCAQLIPTMCCMEQSPNIKARFYLC